MAFTIRTTDGQIFHASDVGHQTDGSITFTDSAGRKLRLAGHFWTSIEGSAGDEAVVTLPTQSGPQNG